MCKSTGMFKMSKNMYPFIIIIVLLKKKKKINNRHFTEANVFFFLFIYLF